MTIAKRPARREIVDKPEQVGGVMLQMREGFRNADYSKLWKAWMPRLKAMHAAFFAERTSPDKQPMAPLSPVTIAKKGHDQPLIETNAMRSSLITGGTDHIEIILDKGFSFGTSEEKAAIHQFGTNKIPARPFVGFKAEILDELVNDVADQAVEFLKG